jgi:hypothetical protein
VAADFEKIEPEFEGDWIRSSLDSKGTEQFYEPKEYGIPRKQKINRPVTPGYRCGCSPTLLIFRQQFR